MVDFKFVCSICSETIKTSKTNYYRSLKRDKNVCRPCHLKESSKSLSILVDGDRITKHRFYSLWCNMIRRCYDDKNVYYKYYGGRGITVCEEWRSSLNFIRWVLDVENIIGKVDSSVQLDRIDNDKGYSPRNCQFITPRENNRKRAFVKLDYKKACEIRKKYDNGSSVKELSLEYSVSRHCIYDVINFRTFINP